MRILVLMVFFVLFICPLGFPQTESMTMTTYYPAPFGAYDVLRLIPRSGAPFNCADGTLYIDKNDNNELHICGGGSGPGSNDNISVWKQSGTDIYPRQGTGQNVGIGTESPSGKLEVAGGTAVFEDIDASGSATIGGGATIGGNASVSGNVSANQLNLSGDAHVGKLYLKADGSNEGELKVQFISGAYYATYAP